MFFTVFLLFKTRDVSEVKESFILTVLLLISSLLEESVDIPKYLVRLRWVIGTWMLTSIIFTNCYLSLAIIRITSPLPVKLAETFDDLLTPVCTLESCPSWFVMASLVRKRYYTVRKIYS